MFAAHPSAESFSNVLYYGCRNPMLHSFTLYVNSDRSKPTPDHKRFTLWLTPDAVDAITDLVPAEPIPRYLVGVRGLFREYVGAIGRYKGELLDDARLQENFKAMWRWYGCISVSGPAEGVR